ncbi:MAG: hypothetical protein IJN42_04345, partial [Clostridia bacterium]|nr:hypothetical protein [Clostridia bacterium]
MKRRLLLLICGVLMLSGGLQSGALGRFLTAAGERAALSALSRSAFPASQRVVATEQGYEEALLVTPTVENTVAKNPSVPVVNLSINNGKYKVTQNVAIKNGSQKAVDVAALLSQGFTKPELSDDEPVV